jgi:hypothetical protein
VKSYTLGPDEAKGRRPMERRRIGHPFAFVNARVGVIAALLFMFAPVTQAWKPKSRGVESGREPMVLDNNALTESSGLAFSNVDSNCIWTHNDSGGKARLFAFNQNGKYCGRVDLKGVKADDWEDVASYDDDGARLLVADVGDNSANRKSVSLYIFDEPDPRKKSDVRSFQHLVVRYRAGAQNCEAVAVDVKNRRILLLGKSALAGNMYQVSLPDRFASSGGNDVTQIEATAVPIRKTPIPMATGMDLCPKSGDLWISSYFHAFCYPDNKGKTLQARLQSAPNVVALPSLKQVEAIAIDDKNRVWVTSEGKPARMQRVLIEK